MAGDLPHGPTELDNYNGYLLELADDINVPLNRAVYKLARQVEDDGSAPGLHWMDELLDATVT
jgi:ketopantoate reductase